MLEVAKISMRSAGWTEIPTDGANSTFVFGDTVMTIFPNGNWRSETPEGRHQAIRQGNINDLEQFLKDFAAANPTL